MASVTLNALVTLSIPLTLPAVANVNTVWTAGGLFGVSERCSWSGFVQSVCDGDRPGVASVNFRPIVNLQPTQENCIYTTLLFITNQAAALQAKTPCVTFDQPLFIKAVDIVLAVELDIVVRLGGFHVLLSFCVALVTL